MGHAHVGVQASVVHGDINYYQASASDDPEKKFAVGLEFLGGHMPREAEQQIGAAVEGGASVSPEVAYYWTLATLSDRSFDELDDEHFRRLSRAFGVGSKAPADDEWAPALGVIARLVQCLIAQDLRGEPDPVEFTNVLDDYQLLSAKRLDELRRHLDRIMAGAIQDQLDAFDAAVVREQRMGDGRQTRAWKFFQADPTEPLPAPIDSPETGVTTWIRLFGGLALGTSGLYFALPASLGFDASAAIIGLILTAGGGLAAARFGFRYTTLKSRLAATQRDYESPPDVDPTPLVADLIGEPVEPSKFAKDIRRLVKNRFELRGPLDSEQRSEWRTDTKGVRAALSHRIEQTYEAESDEDTVSAASLVYLINHHAEVTARAWKAGQLFDFRQQLRVPARVIVGLAAGLSVLCVGVFAWSALLVSHGEWAMTLLSVSGAWHACVGGARICRDRQRLAAERERSDKLFAAEWAAYDRWRDILADRPTDAEMARWLDYDKLHLRTIAMKQYGLTNRDVIAHAVLTEAAPRSQRARVLHGPPRYSQYLVTVYLLTVGGVRQVEVKLDFYNGDTRDEKRTTFSYDAISAVRVTEVGVRFDDQRRYVLLLNDDDTFIGSVADNEFIVQKGLRLSFNSGDTFNVLIESFSEDFADRDPEDRERLQKIAFDTSGISGALWILEAVAAEGRQWIDHERARRKRRIRGFESANGHEHGDTTASLPVLANSVPNPVP